MKVLLREIEKSWSQRKKGREKKQGVLKSASLYRRRRGKKSFA
jgi:hypothetical protein